MDQENPSGFSHITIGRDTNETVAPDEEIEFIGAVELVEAPPLESKVVQDQASINQPRVAAQVQVSQPATDEPAHDSESADGEEQPMVLARRITLALSGLGSVLIVLYVMDYWGIINLPF